MRAMRRPDARMVTHAAAYGVTLAVISLLLAWLDFRRVAHGWSGQFTILLVALLFVALGIWLGTRLVAQARPGSFAPNTAAQRELGISARELEVLQCLARGAPNKVIARELAISPNTVKTHVAQLLAKLSAANRTEAIARARALSLVS